MSKIRRYELDGMLLDIPLRYDELSDIFLEDYSDIFENPIRTPNGYPVMFAGEDACSLAEEATPGGCPDCGCCKHYRRAAEHTWIGMCTHEGNRKNNLKK